MHIFSQESLRLAEVCAPCFTTAVVGNLIILKMMHCPNCATSPWHFMLLFAAFDPFNPNGARRQFCSINATVQTKF